jgi:translation initiation factor 1A
MPPNAKGGKGYKKKKKVTGPVEPIYIDRAGDQQVARVVKLLGDRNVLCYCNDNRLRICHICGRMKGRVWIEPGDVVLISVREMVNPDSRDYNRGDVLAKYPLEHLSKVRREKGVNEKLFMKLESMDGMNLNELGVDKTNDKKIIEDGDCGFEFDRGDETESEEDGSSSSEEDAAAAGGNRIQRSRGGRQMEATQAAGGGDGDIDIDAI